jgi:hypothetical protein
LAYSEEETDRLLSELKAEIEQGLLSPTVKPSFLGIGPDRFVCCQQTFDGNPLPEFRAISWNVLDCFATALISVPNMPFPAGSLMMKCQLGEERGCLMLYLSAMLAAGEQVFPIEMTDESEVWVGIQLRALAKAKELALGNIFWNRSGPLSFFFFAYPGQMVRGKVPGLGALGDDGKRRWPECKFELDPIDATTGRARSAIDFIRSHDENPIS